MNKLLSILLTLWLGFILPAVAAGAEYKPTPRSHATITHLYGHPHKVPTHHKSKLKLVFSDEQLNLLGQKTAQVIIDVYSPPGVGSVDLTFTPTQLYFVDPVNGSDANSGLTPAAAWATANHTVNCGDVLLTNKTTSFAAPYTTVQNGPSAGQVVFGDENYPTHSFGQVNNCPSTTGGIDGRGGIYFAILLCVGPDLMSCPVNSSGVGGPAFDVSLRPNWLISGFWATMATNGDRDCYDALGQNPGDYWAYFAVVNSIANTCDLGGFGTGSDTSTGWTALRWRSIYPRHVGSVPAGRLRFSRLQQQGGY